MTEPGPRALVLLDRDGCLVEERHYLADPDQVVLLPRAARAIRLLAESGIACVVASNQSGVARGYFTEDDMLAVHSRFEELLEAQGAFLDGYYYAVAHPDAAAPELREGLGMRKPNTGMIEDAREDLELPDAPLFTIGDKAIDVAFGRNGGGTGILVRTGYGAGEEAAVREAFPGAPVCDDVYDAACRVLNELILAEARWDETLARKLCTAGEARAWAADLRAGGRTSVLANGCFDLLHGGHVSFLEDARAAGDGLVLAVNSNASIARLKGAGRPILDETARLQMLAALEAVDRLVVFHPDSADEVLEEIRPDVHAKGTDYRSDNVPELQTSRRLGIRTVIAGAAKENSTRDIIEVIVERARRGLL
jgi:D-glycero-D-manno-heptose 1,7-bisphosphate phosphatase